MQQKHAETPIILIVEDDEGTGDVIAMAIKQETAYHPVVVTTGQDALEALQSVSPNLFLIDYRLPDMTGIQLYDRLQETVHLQSVPTILMSASKPIEKIEPRDVALLSKPFDLDEFLQLIEHCIGVASVYNAC